MNTQKFAVLMAAYNGALYIQEQIASILSQQHIDVHLFISVDPSTDATSQIVESYAKSDMRITLLPNDGRIFGGAGPNFFRIFCDIDFSDFDYVCLADQDDIWDHNKLHRASTILISTGADGYSSSFTAIWPNHQRRYIKKSFKQVQWDFLFESAGPGCTYVVKKDLGIDIKKLILSKRVELAKIEFHDWLIYAYARQNGYIWIIDEWPSILYRQHPNNQLGVNFGIRSFILRAKRILNGYGAEQALHIANLIGADQLPFVQKGLLRGKTGYAWLAFQSSKCRRKKIDKVLFFFSCILMALVN